MSALLSALGFDVTLHVAGVQTKACPPNIDGNHCALTVRIDGQQFLCDAGLGDGLYEPIPLSPASYRQGPLTFGLHRSSVTDGWRLDHDPVGSFVGMDFADSPAEMHDFAVQHHRLSTSPDSSFVRTFAMLRRSDTTVHILRARLLATLQVGADRSSRLLDSEADLLRVMAQLFGYQLELLSTEDRRTLWTRASRQHQEFQSRPGRPIE